MASGCFQLMTLAGLLSSAVVVVSTVGVHAEISVEFQACRNVTGACVPTDICSVPTFRLREDGCPSDLECCPKAAVTVANFQVMNRTEIPVITSTESAYEETEEWSTDESPMENGTENPQRQRTTTTIQTSTETDPTTSANDLPVSTENTTENLSTDSAVSVGTIQPPVSGVIETQTHPIPSTDACEAACQEAHKTVKNVYPMTSTEVNPTANTDSKEIKGTKTADNAEDDVDEMHKQELQGQLISVTTSFTNDEDLSAETVAHNAPWLATIFNGTGFHCCNGALLTNRSVVSIATCFSLCGSSVGEWRVKVGQWYSNANNTFNPDEFQVSCFKRHSNFKSITRINNIAILKLNRAVRFDSTIQPISLPTNAGSLNDVTFNLSYTGWSDSVALIGWKENVALKTIATETIKDNSCEAWVRKNQPSFKFDASFKCITSTDHKLICDNKAGGPVVAVMAGHSIPRYILYGLVSKNVGCDREQSFAILTNVSPFAEWIEKNLNMSGCSESVCSTKKDLQINIMT
ncbi:melanization protease 1-like [Anopheles albimanus]|uniref:melanization protease 1-like n=1 Tax=Anopheles albimanus TaxID=7167 RepID=UPI001641B618|nr:melanization protease 1-like [Anopheles albimanus]